MVPVGAVVVVGARVWQLATAAAAVSVSSSPVRAIVVSVELVTAGAQGGGEGGPRELHVEKDDLHHSGDVLATDEHYDGVVWHSFREKKCFYNN